VRLQLKGFTSYREPQEIDFEGLDLFAITGQTGSGKSSLLDAMTYALYGKVPRVGKGVGQLISHGQPRMSVLYEFDVGGERYRVTRTTPARGQTTVLLERRMGGEWQSFGEGADRIAAVNAHVERLLGLDYDAFTRSVLLPQGQFAEFLKADSPEDKKKRREILTELLGLELFGRMAQRAGMVANEAKASKQTAEGLLVSQFAGVDAAAVKDARAAAKRTAAAASVMNDHLGGLEALAARWETEDRRRTHLLELADQTSELSTAAARVAAGLEGSSQDVTRAELHLAECEETAVKAEAAATSAALAVEESERRLGSREALVRVRSDLAAVLRAQSRLVATEESLTASRARAAGSLAALSRFEAAVTEGAVRLEGTVVAREAAEAEHEQAHRRDLAGSLAHDLHAGDPCPVCDRPLEAAPRIPATDLVKARRTLDKARAAERSAAEAVSAAERDLAVARSEVTAAKQDAVRCETEVRTVQAERDEVGAAVVAFFGGEVPDDPQAEVERREREAKRLAQEWEAHRSAAAEAHRAAEAARDLARDAQARAGTLAAELRALPAVRLAERVRRTHPDLEVPTAFDTPDSSSSKPARPERSAEAARDLAAAAAELHAALTAAATKIQEDLRGALDAAIDGLPEGTLPARDAAATPAAALTVVRSTCQRLTVEAATAKQDAERLAEQLTQRAALEKQIVEHGEEMRLYQALAAELRADRLITFLQGEALQLLATAGSQRLLFLSQGRYVLVFEGDEFFVEDRQNGDERRSVRTLSGGETFLASLALALALSEQIQSLAVTEKSRLESLFIDEGFGALDADSLAVASEAVEQLGGDERMVGLITHVWELAERLPVRIEVEKLPKGSRLRVIS
jgi:exonuclease SbcC